MSKTLKFTSGVIIVLTLVQLVASNYFATSGVVLGSLEDNIDKYKKENAILREKLLTESSLVTLSKKAKKLGFSEAKTTVLLSSAPIALKP